jgi:H+/Cl- antiporter ClcA
VLVALAVGTFAIFIFGPLRSPTGYGDGYQLNPGVTTIYIGLIGGLIGGLIDRAREKRGGSNKHLSIKMAIAALVIGFSLGFVWWMLTSP